MRRSYAGEVVGRLKIVLIHKLIPILEREYKFDCVHSQVYDTCVLLCYYKLIFCSIIKVVFVLYFTGISARSL